MSDAEEGPICDECGDSDGRIQLVAIAWPRSPKAEGSFIEAWLHFECEAVYIARQEQKAANK